MGSKSDKNFVDIRVVKHLPLGLSVELNDGEYGIVRIREVSWDAEITLIWKKNFPVGWKG